MTQKSTKKGKIIALISFIVIFIGLIIFLFSGKNFQVLKEIFRSGATKAEIQESIGKLGIRSYIVVFIISMLQVILTFVPAEPLHVVSGISFGLWKGMAVCLAGIMLGNTIIYILYKIFGKKLTDYFATNVDFDFESAKQSNKLALIVIILYCLPAIPYGIICFFAASMGMKYHKYILITGIGSIPSLVLDVGLGHITMSTSWLISIIVFIVIIVLLILMYKYKTQIFDKVNKYIRKTKEKAQNQVGNYNPFIYWCVGSGVYSFIKTKIKIKLKNNVGKLEKPCIVLCNHGSFYDFVYAGKLLRKEKPHFVVARMYFHHKWLNRVLRGTGAFPKSMFTADVESSKNCLKVINGGGVLAMMPEARLSTVGTFEDIQDTTFKFIQKMNVAVYTIKINGSYLARPKWANSIRKGSKVEATLDLLFSAGETGKMPIEEIKTKVETALDYNEWQWLDENRDVEYKTKDIAEGLENVLSVCPKCKSKHTLVADKNKITCENCDLEVSLDNRYQMTGCEFANVLDWYNYQKDLIKKEIINDNNYVLEDKVQLKHLSKDGKKITRHAGEGICRLSRDGFTYIGTDDGKNVEKVFTLEQVYRILFGAGEDFEIYDGKELYYFVPENKRSCVMWYMVSEILKEI